MPVNKCTQTKDAERLSEVVERSKEPPKKKTYYERDFATLDEAVQYINKQTKDIERLREVVERSKQVDAKKKELPKKRTYYERDFATLDEAVQYINKHTAKIIDTKEIVETYRPFHPLPRDSFQDRWRQVVECRTEEGKVEKVNVWRHWLNHPLVRQYDNVEFRPDINETEFYEDHKNDNGEWITKRYMNFWRGLQVEPIEGDFPTIKRHMFEIIANRREEAYEWLMDYFAWFVQHPAARAAILVMKSEEGAGKGVVDAILRRVFGTAFAQYEIDYIAGHFNAALFGKSVIHINESVGTTRAQEGAIKRIATEDIIAIQKKFKEAEEKRNTARIIVSSNKDTPVSVEAKTRRIVTIEVSNELVNATKTRQREYFQPLYESVKEGEKDEVPQFLYHLLKRNLKHFKGVEVPEFATDAAFSSIMSGKNSYWKWLYAVLSYGSIYMDSSYGNIDENGKDPLEGKESVNWSEKIRLEACNRKYLEYCNENRLQPIHEVHRGKIHGKVFREALGETIQKGVRTCKTKDRSSPPNRLWPSRLEESRELFAKSLGVSVEVCFEDE